MRRRYLNGLAVRDRSLHEVVVDLLAADAEVMRAAGRQEESEIVAANLIKRDRSH